MFKSGDIVEMTADAAATGMLDFVEGDGYKVIDVYTFSSPQIKLRDEGGKIGWFVSSHFKLKEDTVESNKNHFKVGQTVWCILYGKGVITDVGSAYQSYPIDVRFPDGTRSYTVEGSLIKEFGRTLFFSEPKIEAATEPLFEPILKKGDVVIISRFKDWTIRENFKIGVVEEETEEFVYTTGDDPWDKYSRYFYRLGEKINFK